MVDNQTKQAIKERLGEILKYYGAKEKVGNWDCLSSRHKNPEKDLTVNGNICCCHCDLKGDSFNVVGIMEGTSNFIEQYKKACNILNIKYDGKEDSFEKSKTKQNGTNEKAEPKKENKFTKKDIEKWHEDNTKTEYFEKRGISKDLINKYKLGYDASTKQVVLPVTENYIIKRYISENFNGKPHRNELNNGESVTITNKHYTKTDEVIFVVEGYFDMLSIEELGFKAISLNSTSQKDLFLKSIKQSKATYILALDNDQEGDKSSDYLEMCLKDTSIEFKRFSYDKQYKDINEYLIENKSELEGKLKQVINKQAKEYLATNTANYLQNFIDGIGESVNTSYIPTNFKKLDNIFDGGFYEGLYIIGAISSLGKTTLALQIVDQIAQQGQDILIFSLEMARNELIAKSISRTTFLLSDDIKDAKTTRGVTTGKRYSKYRTQEKRLIADSMGAYKEYASNIYIHEGLGDIGVNEVRKTVEKHIKFTGKTPLVFIDYLQILAPYDARSTDKQNCDKAVLELKRISRDNKLTVFAISSFNRDNYSKPVSMLSFKESGAIEYSSDVLMGLQLEGQGEKDFDVDEAKAKDPRKIELKILKNRNGATGGKILYDYYPLFNLFDEVDTHNSTTKKSISKRR